MRFRQLWSLICDSSEDGTLQKRSKVAQLARRKQVTRQHGDPAYVYVCIEHSDGLSRIILTHNSLFQKTDLIYPYIVGFPRGRLEVKRP